MTIDAKQKQAVPPKKASAFVNRAIQEGRNSLLEYEADQVAKEYGISVLRAGLATTEKRAVFIARRLGFPVAMKIASPDIPHKTDAGGVKLDINSNSKIIRAFGEITRNARKVSPKADIRGVYIQRMAPKSQEFVVGGLRDPQFGPTVMFGLGGIFVELYKDVSFRLAPVSSEEALEMMKETRAAALLTGFRGSKPLDMESAANVIQAVGKMMTELEVIESVDINPLLIYPNGCKAVDVRMMVSNARSKPHYRPRLGRTGRKK